MNIDRIALESLIFKIRSHAEMNDRDALFPEKEFQWMRELGLLSSPLCPVEKKLKIGQTAFLIKLLQQIGSVNLAVGRVYEGHVNALHLIGIYGSPQQQAQCFDVVLSRQVLFGVWNTQNNAEGVKIHDIGNGQYRLEGSKIFCSGAGWIQRPIITGELISDRAAGWQMCIIPEVKVGQIIADSLNWQPLGMRTTASYKMDLSGIVIDQIDLLGSPDAYYQQPYFSGGAIRYLAVQMGAAQSILEETHQFLRIAGRTQDSFQQSRMALISNHIETGMLWLEKVSIMTHKWEESGGSYTQLLAYVNMTRTVVGDICLKCMQLAERSVGVSALLKPHALERLHRDLTTYLKQPAPDEALTSVGKYIFSQEKTEFLWKVD